MPNKVAVNWTAAPIEELGLSTRAFNAVRFGPRLRTVGELAGVSEAILMHYPNFGAITLRECRTKIRQFLTDCGEVPEASTVLHRASIEAGCKYLSFTQASAMISSLADEGWELRRV